MMKNELISVIIPVYNRKECLQRCFSSIDEQSVQAEIIIVDDGSTDGSSYIIDDYRKQHSNCIVIHQPNLGLSAARNAGLDICRGDYIFFLDSDDYLEKEALADLLRAIKETDSDVCICKYSRYFEDGALEYENHLPDYAKNKVITKEGLLSLMYIENSYLWCVAWGKLYKRKVFDNIRFPVGKNSEDEYIMPLILEKASKFYVLDESLYHQVLTKNSIVRNDISIKTLDASEAVLEMIWYLLDKGYYEYALFRFGVATRWLLLWKSMAKNSEIKEAIKCHYTQYRKVAKKLISYVDIKNKIRLSLFCLNFQLYGFIQNLCKKVKKNEKVQDLRADY
ncbi:Glycosyltransferase involved in cell wall bisynthesis [Butyrivibrio sp. Su6]|uniref:glycosyltransferase family 2 protein n=1 Tax=Butyrivibrio sp. Su6 TaxID=1520810 RepID=UPI00089E1940|nr:glycosyltransferase family 2 protein [Butyrivibrio sp. Su6]SEG25979.1 Glycosyltransferase involved in cell wall bisynthesis [Butyrivibrio sp. Su6]